MKFMSRQAAHILSGAIDSPLSLPSVSSGLRQSPLLYMPLSYPMRVQTLQRTPCVACCHKVIFSDKKVSSSSFAQLTLVPMAGFLGVHEFVVP